MIELENLESEILAWFKAGNTLTVRSCWKRFKTSELRQYVSRIKSRRNGKGVRENYIVNTWQQAGGKRFKAYYLKNAASTHSAESR